MCLDNKNYLKDLFIQNDTYLVDGYCVIFGHLWRFYSFYFCLLCFLAIELCVCTSIEISCDGVFSANLLKLFCLHNFWSIIFDINYKQKLPDRSWFVLFYYFFLLLRLFERRKFNELVGWKIEIWFCDWNFTRFRHLWGKYKIKVKENDWFIIKVFYFFSFWEIKLVCVPIVYCAKT